MSETNGNCSNETPNIYKWDIDRSFKEDDETNTKPFHIRLIFFYSFATLPRPFTPTHMR